MNLFENLQIIYESNSFNVGDKVRIKDEWLDSSNEKSFIYEITNINENTDRYTIQCLNSNLILPPTEIVSSEMIELVNNDVVTESKELSDKITNYWAYKNIIDHGYLVDITDTSVTIKYDDGDVYAHFTLESMDDEYAVYNHGDRPNEKGEFINNDLESVSSYEDAVNGCLYYFWTRY